MSKQIIPALIRWALTFIMLYFSYKETGPFTCLFLFLLVVSMEIHNFLWRKSFELLKGL